MPSRKSPVSLSSLRSVTESDLPFLSRLYASTRTAELAATGWSDAQKIFFLHSQFQLQHNYYQQQFADAQFQLIELSSTPIGRLYYRWDNQNLHLIDIALLPDYRHQQIGGDLMRELMALVRGREGKLLLHVDINNPARQWYLRLGFAVAGNELINGIYQKMEWDSVGSQ